MSPSWRVETGLQLDGDLAVFPFVCQRKSTRVDLRQHNQVWSTKSRRSLPPCVTPQNPRIGI